ncbi:ABC transporter permease [Schaalia sp. ZJ405]|uniref:ABC transporter permease n=1 Tax=Schaalia sp. ZJ405 TaxID=2709403 RepID=UPI0013EBBED4|nr:ABC transporter permease [Schaalia sp. ZJ405]QPK80767.1 ABC transporter permease [Schaalia sp. ZJ405]
MSTKGITAKTKKSFLSGLDPRILWTVVAIVLLIAVCAIKDPAFLKIGFSHGGLNGPLIDVLRNSAPYLMIAVGMTFVIATAGIDLSVGAVMAVSGTVVMTVMSTGDGSVGSAILALAAAIAVCALIGAWNGALVAYIGLQPFVTTLIMMLAGRGIAKVITDGQNLAAENEAFHNLATGSLLGLPMAWIVATVIVVLVALLMRKTALGLEIEAVGLNPVASRMAGIDPKKIQFVVYIISAALAAMAGAFSVGNVMRVEPANTGMSYEMDAILAVVIGGTSLLGGRFSLLGTYLGALIIPMLEKTIVWLGIPNAATPAFKAVIVIAVCVLQSSLFAKLTTKRQKKTPTVSAGSTVTPAKEGASA